MCFLLFSAIKDWRISNSERAASIRSLFHGNWCSEIRWKKVRWKNWVTANFKVREMYNMLKELLKQWMNASFLVKINTVHFKEWMNAILFVRKSIYYFKRCMAAIRVMK